MSDSFLGTYLPYLLRNADQLLSAPFYDELAAREVTQSEWRVLAVLHEEGAMSMRDLTTTALSPQPTVTHAVARLEKRGLVARSPGLEDKRQRFVSVTRKGQKLAGSLITEAQRFETSALRDAPKRDVDALVDELRSFSEQFETGESTTRPAAVHSVESIDSAATQPLVTPRGAFPHVREANGFAFVSGTSSRRPDNTFAGVDVDEMGTTTLDIAAQTTAVLENIEHILATIGLDRTHLIDAMVFLVNMNDFGGYNEAWATFFGDGRFGDLTPPARTTVAVHQLPHPHLLIEIKATALVPEESA